MVPCKTHANQLVAALRGLAVLDLQIRHQEQVDDIGGVVVLVNDDRSTAGGNRHEFTVLHRYLATVCQMNSERPERRGTVQLPDLLDRHTSPHTTGSWLLSVAASASFGPWAAFAAVIQRYNQQRLNFRPGIIRLNHDDPTLTYGH